MAQPVSAAQRQRAQTVLRLLNPLVRRLLRSPLHSLLSHSLLLLSFTGRKSGKRYTFPVGYVQMDGTLLTRTESGWWKNLRGGAPVTVQLRGQERRGRAEPVTDLDGMLEGYATIMRLSPGYGRSLGVAAGPDGQPERAAVEHARRAGHVVIRIQLD